MQIANHGVCGMNYLLGRAGRTAGIRAEQRTINVSRRFHLTGILLAHLKNPIPRHGSAAVCRLIRIVAVNVLLNMLRHGCIMCAAVRRYHHRNLRIRAVTVCIQLSLREIILRKDNLCAGTANRFYIFFQRVVAAKNRRANFFRCQQQIDKFRHSAQEGRNRIAFTEAKRLQTACSRIDLFEQLLPCDVISIVMHGNDIIPRTVRTQIFANGLLWNFQIFNQLRRIVLHPRAVCARNACPHWFTFVHS